MLTEDKQKTKHNWKKIAKQFEEIVGRKVRCSHGGAPADPQNCTTAISEAAFSPSIQADACSTA